MGSSQSEEDQAKKSKQPKQAFRKHQLNSSEKIKLEEGRKEFESDHKDSQRKVQALQYYDQELYKEALELFEAELKLILSLPNKKPTREFQAYNYIGLCELKLCTYEAALEKFEKARIIAQTSIGEYSREYCDVMNNIGIIYSELGKLKDSLAFQRIALSINKRLLPEGHIQFATSHTNLGSILERLGKYKEAAEQIKLAVKVLESKYGADDTRLISPYSNLALIYIQIGKIQEAQEIVIKNLEICAEAEKYPIENEEDLANAYKTAGVLYEHLKDHDKTLSNENLGNYDKAIELYEKSYEINQQIYGEESEEVANITNNLAMSYNKKKKFDEAMKCIEVSTRVLTKIFGEDHPRISIAKNNTAVILKDQGLFKEALPYSDQALQLSIKKYGTDHPYVATFYNRNGQILERLNRLEEAQEQYYKCYSIRIAVLGNSHPETIAAKEVYDQIRSQIAQQG